MNLVGGNFLMEMKVSRWNDERLRHFESQPRERLLRHNAPVPPPRVARWRLYCGGSVLEGWRRNCLGEKEGRVRVVKGGAAAGEGSGEGKHEVRVC